MPLGIPQLQLYAFDVVYPAWVECPWENGNTVPWPDGGHPGSQPCISWPDLIVVSPCPSLGTYVWLQHEPLVFVVFVDLFRVVSKDSDFEPGVGSIVGVAHALRAPAWISSVSSIRPE
ncbi:hypothetical protein H113_00599 [Trichophyton rubrum MR1459]|uniref:Uncharacterized protein n=1 Tax=Trichophyton rubrum (strain ATCC MYA-4607 / CBS 118892) TaxID=559305 RepID=A0A080WMH4_TRIRC|nr:uncharacterized protein TERG_12661 [Trichophyton rubrum CBS 118892]EZF99886.1 hypothetical protein H113_00599 [Trichophyton rubrum MR1459]EZG10912.1 hypothetical protein H106_00476 [Trichophyton rubrum CBS 735.88]KFL62984.1 hypothetical protein TERG_12661 [Trichophyton rubrum CBS 118892]